MSSINRTPSWVLETAEERATRLRNKVETDEERQGRLRKRVETLEERAARLRKNLTCGRWKREETLFKQVHELATDFECEVYLIVQHHGEKDRQVYHSQPEKKEWVTDYQTLLEECWPPIVENNRKTMGPTKKQLARLAERSQLQNPEVGMDQTRGPMDMSHAQIQPAPDPEPETPTQQATARQTGSSHTITALRSSKRRRYDVEDGLDEDDSDYNIEDCDDPAGTRAAHEIVPRTANPSAHHGNLATPCVDRVALVNSVADGASPPKDSIAVNGGIADHLIPPRPICDVGPPSGPRTAPLNRGAVLAQGLARSLQMLVHDVNKPAQDGRHSHMQCVNFARSDDEADLGQHNSRGLAPSLLQRTGLPPPTNTSENNAYENRRFELDPEALEIIHNQPQGQRQASETPKPRRRLQKSTRRVPKRVRRLRTS